jgi:hypothetical protein
MRPSRESSDPGRPAGSVAVGRAVRAAAVAALPAVAAGLRSQPGRALVRALRGSGRVERLPSTLLGIDAPRHPMAPAAMRVERTRARGAEAADQVAVTVWFGEGPALPSLVAPRARAGRTALRIGASLLGAAAVAAVTTAAARLAEAEHPRIVDAR